MKRKKVSCKYKTETPENIWFYEFVCLRSKACSYKRGNVSGTNLNSATKPVSTRKRHSESADPAEALGPSDNLDRNPVVEL